MGDEVRGKPPMFQIGCDAIQFCCRESCGKCIPCRIGSKRMAEAVARIDGGEGTAADIDALAALAAHMKRASACGTGQSAGATVLGILDRGRAEVEAYIAVAGSGCQTEAVA